MSTPMAAASYAIDVVNTMCLGEGYAPKTVGLYCKLLTDLVRKWHAHTTFGTLSEMLCDVDWVEATLRSMYTARSMPTYLGYIVSVLKANPVENLTLGKRRPELVPSWYVYAERCAHWRGVVLGMKGEIVDVEIEHADVGVQTDEVVDEPATPIDFAQPRDDVVPNAPSKKRKADEEFVQIPKKVIVSLAKSSIGVGKLVADLAEVVVNIAQDFAQLENSM